MTAHDALAASRAALRAAPDRCICRDPSTCRHANTLDTEAGAG